MPWVVGATASHLRVVAAGDRRDLFSLHCISGFFEELVEQQKRCGEHKFQVSDLGMECL